MYDFAILSAIVFSSQLASHWFPWQQVLKRKLPRLAAYTLGVLTMGVPLVVWFIIQGYWTALWGLITVTVSSGAAVFLGYAIDAYLMAHAQNEISDKIRALGESDDQNDPRA